MANSQNQGFEWRWSVGANVHSFSGSSTRFDFVSSSVKKQGEMLDSAGLTGSRTLREDRTRAGLVRVGGTIVMEPSHRMLDFFLPYILGANESTDTFNVADSLQAFDLLQDPFGTGSNATVFPELYVNRATLRFAPGLLRLSLDVIGKAATAGQAFAGAALGAGIEYSPMVFYDTASLISIQSTTVEILEGELVIDNQLDVQFRNSQTAMSIRPTGRIVTLNVRVPLIASYWTAFFGDKSAVDATIAMVRSNMSTTITCFNLKNPDEGPEVDGKSEVWLTLAGQARGDSSDPDIRFTNDPVS